jgi:hypothetical protein
VVLPTISVFIWDREFDMQKSAVDVNKGSPVRSGPGIRDNHSRGSVGDFLRLQLRPGADLDLVTAYFTIFAYDKLRAHLDALGHIRLLFGEPAFIKNIDPTKSNGARYVLQDDGLALANGLSQRHIAQACARWMHDKVEVRSVMRTGFLHGKMAHIRRGEVSAAILGSSNFTTRGLGLASTNNNVELNLIVRDDRDRDDLLNWFEELWEDADRVEDVTRVALLEYRSLLRTNFDVTNVKERLFELAVGTLLANVPIPVAGGRERTIGQLWSKFEQSKPRRRTRLAVSRLAEAEKAFNDGFRAILPDVEKKAGEFLSYFADASLQVKLGIVGVRFGVSPRYSRDWKFIDKELEFSVKLHGIEISEWNQLLNEARLSALAISLYLAGAILGNPKPPPSVGAPLRLLVLDDVLIGLDLANRLPVLDLIQKEFVAKDWQVLLFTFDRTWYEVAKQQLRQGAWLHQELFAVRVGDFEKPLLLQDDDHLLRALAFLDEGQVKAAAVHVRTKFELVLKWACETFGLPVKYQGAPHRVPASDFWAALRSADYKVAPPLKFFRDGKGKLGWYQPKPIRARVIPPELNVRIEHAVSWVLNPLTHSQTVDRYRREIEDAIYAVDELERTVQHTLRSPEPAQTVIRQMLLRLLDARIAVLAPPAGAPRSY